MAKFFLSLILSISFILTNVIAKESSSLDPHVYGEAYVVIDGETNEIILGKNIDQKMYPASITKLITAILLAEHKNPSDILEFTQSAKEVPEYSVNLNYYPMEVGQELSADFVMKSILIFSANDMAQVVADNISHNLNVPFEDVMNNKLKDLGLNNTNFKNAIGLHNDDHYSTAYDLAILLKEALKYEWIREVMSTRNTTVSLPDGSLVVYENSNKLIGIEGMIGGKTGYTSRAGRTLVGAFENDGRLYIGTVLKSVYDADDSYVFNDMLNIVKSSITREKTLLYRSGDEDFMTAPLEYKLFGFFGPNKVKEVPIMLKEDVYIYDNQYNMDNISTSLVLNQNINIFTNGNTPIGTLNLKILDYEQSYEVIANMSDLLVENLYIYVLTLVGVLIVILSVVFVFLKISKRKRSKNIWR